MGRESYGDGVPIVVVRNITIRSTKGPSSKEGVTLSFVPHQHGRWEVDR
jgi:hypothetical protein